MTQSFRIFLPRLALVALTSLTLQGFSNETSSEVQEKTLYLIPRKGSIPPVQPDRPYAMNENIKEKTHKVKGPAHKRPPILEVRAGYFTFSDSKMRKIYKDGGLDLQLSASGTLWEWLQLYGSIGYLEKRGKALSTGFKTTIYEVPLSLGLKPVAAITNWLQLYFTIGPRYIFVHQHNHSPYLDKKVADNGIGGFGNVGFIFFPMRHFIVDVFGEYSYKRIHYHSHKTNVYDRDIQIGGWTVGGGLGYAF